MGVPVNSLASPRFCGVRTFQRLPHSADCSGNDFAVLGVPFDTATSYRPGCRFGPAAIRDASSILKSYHSVLDVDIFEHCQGVDAGDVDIIPGYLDESFERIEAAVAGVLDAGAVPVIMGGDHSITLPELRAVAKRHGPVALLHFDAHSDTGDDFFGKPYNHGTTFHWAIEEGLILPEQSTQAGIRGPLYSRSSLDYAKGKGMRVISGWNCTTSVWMRRSASCASGSAPEPRFSSPSISISSTPPMRRGPGRRKSAASPPMRPSS